MIKNKFADRCLKIASELLHQPTAPLCEDLPREYLRAFAQTRRSLAWSEDRAGNVLIKYPARGQSKSAPLALVGHLDHPGFWITQVSAKGAQLLFKGFVASPHASPGARVLFFERGKAQATGAGELVKVVYKKGRLFSAFAKITTGQATARGFAMWDFPAFTLKNGAIFSRSCDDLLGSAAALCALDQIAQCQPKNVALYGLFTRAEEIGFLGALEAIRLKTAPKNACVLSLETSKALPNAPQGDGVIIRVGDKASIFNPNVTDALCKAAQQLGAKNRQFKFQRKLMDGGSCEATSFCAYGYRASGLAVPLGNYHNQAFDKNGKPTIGPENVRIADFLCEAQLLVELFLHPKLWRSPIALLPDWIKERAAQAQSLVIGH